MADGTPRKGLRSAGGKTPLRSRGFLSQPGDGAPVQESRDAADPTAHHRSRGTRQVRESRDGRAEDLSPPSAIRPYTLEEQ